MKLLESEMQMASIISVWACGVQILMSSWYEVKKQNHCSLRVGRHQDDVRIKGERERRRGKMLLMHCYSDMGQQLEFIGHMLWSQYDLGNPSL